MSQATDVVLGGDGYMLTPGTWRRQTDGVAESAPGTLVLSDFVGGQRRAIQLEAERGWDSEGVGPALLGQGVEPWPHVTDHADGAIGIPLSTTPVPAALVGDHIYIGIGRYLYRSVAVTAASWADFTQVADLGSGNAISGLARYADKLAVLCGDTADIQIFDPVAGTYGVLQAGERGAHGAGYAGQLIYAVADAGDEAVIRMTTGGGIDSRSLDSPVVAMTLHAGSVAIATRSSLYLLGGKPDATTGEWIGEPDPFFTHGAWTGPDDFGFLISFGGRLFTWLGNTVMEWNPNSGSGRQGWRSVGLEGRECYGATVSGSWLIVSMRAFDGSGQLWAYDGTGWWQIEHGAIRIWPVSLAGAGRFDLLGFRDASATYDLYRLVHRDLANHAYRAQGAWRTSLLHAGHPDETKVWRAIRASFASPEERGNHASADYVDLTIRYSLDGGETWITGASQSVGGTISRVYELGGILSGVLPQSQYIQIEIGWSSVSDWAPTLTAIAVEYERLSSAARRRRWQLGVTARDRMVERDGQLHQRTSAEIVADLWSIWETGGALAFRDIDFDADPVERTVRVVGIVESSPKPAQTGSIATSQLVVTLVEV